MSHVKIRLMYVAGVAFFVGCATLLLFSPVSLLQAADTPAIWSYEGYTQTVSNVCYATTGDKIPPWNRPPLDSNNTLLTIAQNNYPDIYDPDSNQKFKEGIAAIKWNQNELLGKIALEGQNLPLGSQIEKASILYKERMNALYACAVLNTKLRIHTRLIDEFKPQGSNIIRNLEQATRQIESQMSQRSCRNLSEWSGQDSEMSLKKELIRESTLEYCNYRHYLKYVDDNVKNQLWRVIETEQKIREKQYPSSNNDARFRFTDVLANEIAGVSERTVNEIAQTERVFDDAFDAYREFERNYASHILMVLIEDRYLLIREYLRDTMNPIGQVIYKASNATSKGK